MRTSGSPGASARERGPAGTAEWEGSELAASPAQHCPAAHDSGARSPPSPLQHP
ncbi:hypothetical protein ACRRTK_001260 [Alexandromys fortis]